MGVSSVPPVVVLPNSSETRNVCRKELRFSNFKKGVWTVTASGVDPRNVSDIVSGQHQFVALFATGNRRRDREFMRQIRRKNFLAKVVYIGNVMGFQPEYDPLYDFFVVRGSGQGADGVCTNLVLDVNNFLKTHQVPTSNFQ